MHDDCVIILHVELVWGVHVKVSHGDRVNGIQINSSFRPVVGDSEDVIMKVNLCGMQSYFT